MNASTEVQHPSLESLQQRSTAASQRPGPLRGKATPIRERIKSVIRSTYRKVRPTLTLLIPMGRVSRLHYYEAKERYESLSSMLDQYKRIRAQDDQTSTDKEKTAAIEGCDQLLAQAAMYITRRQNDLNILWRLLTRARIMIVEDIMPPESLPAQIDFCQEEALRLAVSNDVDIKTRLVRLTELLDEDNPKKNIQGVYRRVRALMERFTTLRTGRIHQQFINIRTYQILLGFLFLIGVVLINSWELIVLGKPSGVTQVPVFTWPAAGLPFLSVATYWIVEGLKYAHLYMAHLLETNIAAFVFFGGLTGGFFSATIRIRDRDLTPGEDAYFIWYVITKPFVGAMGAILLYILVQGGLQDVAVLQGVNKATQGPGLFGFAFLSGFSERIFFGGLNYTKKGEGASEDAKK